MVKPAWNTYKLICLLAVAEQRALVLLLVLHEGLDVHIETFTTGTLRRLGGELALLEEQSQQGEERMPGGTNNY